MNVLKRFLLSFMLMLTCTLVYAQTEITGTVVDETGETVIGATVVEKGTSNGTVTDFDGNFVIKVNPGTILVVSYIGYEKMEVAAENGMTITLKDNAVELKELVVTGYQVQRKADLTGAVAVMDMKGPISDSDPNMLNSMQGKLSGVDIVTDAAPGGGSSTIRVRGMSTVNACDPLYVIDGVATNENLNSLNSADIESIQVLKDASSASIYGSRAANGVIIITTKKGKDGRMAINVTAVKTIAGSPLIGYGVGDYDTVLSKRLGIEGYPSLEEQQLNAHNQYTETALAIGIIGLAAMLWWLVMPLCVAWRRKKGFWPVLVLTFIVMFCFLFESMLERQMGMQFVSLIYALMVLIMVVDRVEPYTEHEPVETKN